VQPAFDFKAMKRMEAMRERFFLPALLLLGVASPALSAPQRTTAVYDDWTLVCALPADKPKQCEIVSIQTLAEQNTPVGQISVSHLEKNGPYKLIIQTPPNAWVQTGVKLSVEEKDSVPASFKWCVNTRCAAEGEVAEPMIDRLAKQNTPSSFVFKDAAQHDVTIGVSLKGFGPALEAMEK
jgi:invasion protein IalB